MTPIDSENMIELAWSFENCGLSVPPIAR